MMDIYHLYHISIFPYSPTQPFSKINNNYLTISYTITNNFWCISEMVWCKNEDSWCISEIFWGISDFKNAPKILLVETSRKKSCLFGFLGQKTGLSKKLFLLDLFFILLMIFWTLNFSTNINNYLMIYNGRQPSLSSIPSFHIPPLSHFSKN